jgi:hypothetical protein
MTPAVSPFTRRFVAPAHGKGGVRPPALLGVDLADHEDIEWIWQHTAEGQSQVTGYRIVPRLPKWLRMAKEASDG